MMTYSNRYINKMSTALTGTPYYDANFTHSTNDDVNYNNNNVFSKFMIVHVNRNDFELPVFSRCVFEKILMTRCNEDMPDSIVIPLFTGHGTYRVNTSDPIIYKLFSVPFEDRLVKITTDRRLIYYGNRGNIFNSDKESILMFTISVHREDNMYHYLNYNIRVNPSIFLSESLIEKNIIKKVIPFYLSRNFNFTSMFFNSARLCGMDYGNKIEYESTPKVKIIVDDNNSFFYEPKLPDIGMNEDIHNILKDNVDYIAS